MDPRAYQRLQDEARRSEPKPKSRQLSFTPEPEPEEDDSLNPEYRGKLSDPNAVRSYLTAGRATITLLSTKTGTRYTFKVTKKEDERHVVRYFVSLLSGPDNESSYVYLGMIQDNVFRLTKSSKMKANSRPYVAFAWMWDKIIRRKMPKDSEIWHEGRCGRCGRKLTVPSSIAAGIGPDCAEKMGL